MKENRNVDSDIPSAYCPLCGALGGGPLLALDCGTMDGSTLYSTVRLQCCPQCHHCFNAISGSEVRGLIAYYNAEYAPANLGVADTAGDRPGSAGSLTTHRYDHVYDALAPFAQVDHAILDVGCAQGGFLDFLWNKGYRNLAGVDMTDPYVEKARDKKRYRIEKGSAEALPFEDETIDVIVMEQVLEHCFDPLRVFREAKRVLKKNGFFYIGVPDAARYGDYYFFDFYWLLLREHLQHFDLYHLDLLAGNEGFERCGHRATALAVMSDRMVMPNLSAVFRSCNGHGRNTPPEGDGLQLSRHMSEYIETEKARQAAKTRRIEALRASGRPVFIWGIGREFLYLYESANVKQCRIAGLIDANPFKQQTCSVQGMPVVDPSVLSRESSKDSVLVITALAHVEAVKKSAKAHGFNGGFFEF